MHWGDTVEFSATTYAEALIGLKKIRDACLTPKGFKYQKLDSGLKKYLASPVEYRTQNIGRCDIEIRNSF